MQTHFPTVMYDILEEAESNGHAHVISWCNDGLSFKIHNPDQMVPILQNYFSQTKYKSFIRQLQVYGFTRITKGAHKNTCFHKFLVKGKRFMCLKMKRKERKPKNTKTLSKPRREVQEQELLQHIGNHANSIKYSNNHQAMPPSPNLTTSSSCSSYAELKDYHMPLAPTAKSAIAQDSISNILHDIDDSIFNHFTNNCTYNNANANDDADDTNFLSSLVTSDDQDHDWLKGITYEGADIVLEPDKFASTVCPDLTYSDTDNDTLSVATLEDMLLI